MMQQQHQIWLAKMSFTHLTLYVAVVCCPCAVYSSFCTLQLTEMSLEESGIRVLIHYFYKQRLSTRATVKETCDIEGDGTVSRSKVSRQYRCFNSEDLILDDQPHSI